MDISINSRAYIGAVSLFILILFFLILIRLKTKKDLKTSIRISTLSLGVSYILMLISIVIALFPTYITYALNLPPISDFVSIAIASPLQIGMAIILFRIKRFRNGLPFLYRDKFTIFDILIYMVSMFAVIVISESGIPHLLSVFLILTVFVFAVGIITWWRKNMSALYIDKVKDTEILDLTTKVKEQDDLIFELTESNKRLSAIIHKDNHLIPALHTTIGTFLTERLKGSEHEEYALQILSELEQKFETRADLLLKNKVKSGSLPSTGVLFLDGIFQHQRGVALQNNIEFDLMVAGNIPYLVRHIINQTKLETLLSDHIKDAIIALGASRTDTKRIAVFIGKIEESYEIIIQDNGIPFEPETLLSLGLKRITTHADEGGSGIGFMTTFETLRETGASLIITEYAKSAGKSKYTKNITIRFDNNNAFIIRSYRARELQKQNTRENLLIEAYKTN
jgi:signal transduction histidine kinase